MRKARVAGVGLTLLAAVWTAGGVWGQTAPGAGANTPTKPAASGAAAPSVDAQATAKVKAVLDALEKDGDLKAAEKALTAQFDALATWGTAKQVDAFRETAWAMRLVAQMGKLPAESRPAALRVMRDHAVLGHTLAFLIKEEDDVPAVYETLAKLVAERGADVEKYAQLAAAICVVHEKPFHRRVNEASPKSPDAVAIFDYFKKYEARMAFGVQNVPAELLIYVVDTTATPAEMTWALGRYPRDPAVGRRFFDIKYDYEHLRTGKQKKVSQGDYTLPNILQFGGVCADQAYYACSVGKSIGVPTAYAAGRSGEVGHAWVGFLQAEGRKGWWNFDMGRYPEYRGVMGVVLDPQTRKGVLDSVVSLTAELIGTAPTDRQNAGALTDAAMHLLNRQAEEGEDAGAAEKPAGSGPLRAEARQADAAAALELIELALRENPGHTDAWLVVGTLAENGRLTLAQKETWAGLILKLCGQRYPDFALAVLAPMVETVDDPDQQNKLWNSAFKMFERRVDLAASIRMAQARMWEEAGNKNNAGQCYLDVITRYANAGPFVITALEGAERLLKEDNRGDKVLVLYEQTFAKIQKPQDMAGPYMRQSNWYRVGMMYAGKLAEAGKTDQAAAVRKQVGG